MPNLKDSEKFGGSRTKTNKSRTRGQYVVTPISMIPPPHLHQTSTSSMMMFQPSSSINQQEDSNNRLIEHHQTQPQPHNLIQPQSLPTTTTTLNAIPNVGDFVQFMTTTTNDGNEDDQDELKWNRHDVCTPCNCICFFMAVLFLLTALMSGIYYGLNFFDGKHLKERVFKAQFVIRNQDFLINNLLENSESNEFHLFSDLLKNKINSLFQQSTISDSFVKTEIVAFERKRNSPSEVIVHINIHLAANKPSVEASDIYLILAEEIINNRLKVFENLRVDHNSIDVQERRWLPREKTSLASTNPWTYKSVFPGMLEGLRQEPLPPPRKCGRIELGYCQFLSYNQTSYPNFFNHWNLSSIEEDFIMYKELIDSECYSLSKEFLCNLLQPECQANEMIILPCQDFCQEFIQSCSKWLPEKLYKKISCHLFPSSQSEQSKSNWNWNQIQISGSKRCRSKPNCATQLRLKSQQHKLCDGILDCFDKSDEISCSYCNNVGNKNNNEQRQQKRFHCGDKQCIPLNLTCDNIKDCHNGADEINCLRLSPTTTTTTSFHADESTGNYNNKEEDNNDNSLILMSNMIISNVGYLQAISKGKNSFVCSAGGGGDHHPYTLTSNTNNNNIPAVSANNDVNRIQQLNKNYSNNYYDNQTPMVGHNICNENHFEKLIQIESKTTTMINGPFTRFVPGTTLPSPYPIQCKNKQVYFMECSNPKCGINTIPMMSLHGGDGKQQQQQHLQHQQKRKAFPGYWPWYAKININGHYHCDGTLIALDTILAQTTCFNNQRLLNNNNNGNINNNLSVVLGSVRLSQNNIEALEYPISEIRTKNIMDYDQKLTLLQLDTPVKVSNIIRPICQNGHGITWTGQHKCVVLNLNYELDVLEHRPVKIVNMEQCRRHLEQQQQQKQFNSTSTSAVIPTLTSSWNHPNYSSMTAYNYNDFNNKLCIETHYYDYYDDNTNELNHRYLDAGDILINSNSGHTTNTNNINNNDNNNNNNNSNNNIHDTCQNCSILGRHLYCLTKNQWQLLAMESRTIFSSYSIEMKKRKFTGQFNNNNDHHNTNGDDNDEQKQLILFQIIPK